MIDVLILGGTWSPEGDAVTSAFTNALDRRRFRPRMVEYPADYGQKVAYSHSKAAGWSALAHAVADAPNQVVIAGYSQGAGIAGDFAAEIGCGFYHGLRAKVVACALIADPMRPYGATLGPEPGGFGIAGQRPIVGIPNYTVAAIGDPITALPAGSPLRSLADLSEYWCLASPAAAMRWSQSLLDVAAQRRLQRWWLLRHRHGWGGTVPLARGYLFNGRHTNAYIDEGHCARLADAVNRTSHAVAC